MGNCTLREGSQGRGLSGVRNKQRIKKMKIFYKCDPKKNKMCTKRIGRGFGMCQRECFATSIVEYSMRDKLGRPIVYFTTEGQEENKLVIHGAQ